MYFTGIISAGEGEAPLTFEKGTLTIKQTTKSKGGGWWGANPILATFKVVGTFELVATT